MAVVSLNMETLVTDSQQLLQTLLVLLAQPGWRFTARFPHAQRLLGREKLEQGEAAKLRQPSVNLADDGEQLLAESYLPCQLVG